MARSSIATVLIYHGLVPKLVWPHADELAMVREAGFETAAPFIVSVLGATEVVAGVGLLVLWRARWPLWVCVVAMALATTAVAVTSPRFLGSAFNAVTLNLALSALAAVALLTMRDAPSAARCRRRAPEES